MRMASHTWTLRCREPESGDVKHDNKKQVAVSSRNRAANGKGKQTTMQITNDDGMQEQEPKNDGDDDIDVEPGDSPSNYDHDDDHDENGNSLTASSNAEGNSKMSDRSVQQSVKRKRVRTVANSQILKNGSKRSSALPKTVSSCAVTVPRRTAIINDAGDAVALEARFNFDSFIGKLTPLESPSIRNTADW